MRSRKSPGEQAGFALVTALLALLLVSGIAIGMVLMANTETSIALNFRDQQLATAAAHAGLEEVRDRLRTTATNSLWSSIPTALPGAASGILYVTDGTAQPWVTTDTYADTQICNEGVTCSSLSGSWYGSASASATYAASPSLPWKWVRVMAKTNNAAGGSSRTYSVDGASNQNRVCWNGSNEIVTTGTSCISPVQQVYETTALAVTPLGSRRMLQMEMGHDPPLGLVGANLPGAVTLDSTGLVTCSGAATITGVDQNTGAPAGSGFAGVAISGDISSCSLTGPTGAAPYDTTPSIWNLTMPASLTPGSGLSSTISTIVSEADNTYTGTPPGGANLGTCSGAMTTWDPRITVINTPGSSLGLTGCGLLLVQTGSDLDLQGTKWQGPVIVYVSAAITLTIKPGGGGGQIDGALLFASNSGSSIAFQYQGGGFPINYDSLYLNYASGKPLRLIASREVIN